jgi:transcriptional regulator with XRE-family HTH domain
MLFDQTATRELTELGTRLRSARLSRNEPMASFAQRIGVSVPTLRAMEQGGDTVAIGHWVSALWALDRLGDLASVLQQSTSLLELARQQAKPQRRRASQPRQLRL